MNQRRRRRRENKKPLSKRSILAAVAGGLSLVAFFVLIQNSYTSGGKVSKVLTGTAVMILLVTLISLFEGGRAFKDTDTSFLSRLMGLIFPLLAEAAWIILYVVGYMV